MRISNHILLGLILLCVMAACHHRPAMDFAAIEAILPTQPDSALAMLDTLHTDPNDFTAKDRAHYYLLLTEAIDKCYLTHTTDSLIRLSADYYAAHHDNPRYAKALYLQGRIYEDWHRNDQAVACWVKALDYGEDSEDYALLFRVASRIGLRYAYQDDADQAMIYYTESLRYAIAANDTSSIAYAHAYLARVHSLREDWSEAEKEYEAAIVLAKTSVDAADALQAALKEFIGILYRRKAFAKADSVIHSVQTMPTFQVDGPFCFVVGDYYRHVDDTVRAIRYLEQAIQLGNFYTKNSACLVLSDLYKKYGLKQEQLAYEALAGQYADSIKSQEVRTTFAPIADYGQEQIARQSDRKLRWIGGLSVGALLLVGGLWSWHRRHYLLRLRAQVERIEILTRQLKELEEANIEQQLKPATELLERMRRHEQEKPLTESEWNALFLLVNYRQDDFYTRLHQRYPELGEAEIELCCLLRMGFGKNEEIATFCNITSSAVTKRKQRLKQHLHIAGKYQKPGELEAFIQGL